MSPSTTILAISSAVGPAARMIVRLSGPEALTLAQHVCPGAQATGGAASRCELRLQFPLDAGTALRDADPTSSPPHEPNSRLAGRLQTPHGRSAPCTPHGRAGHYAESEDDAPDRSLTSQAERTCISIPVWLYTFIAPHSYTGENLAEIHLPGNALLARMILRQFMALGAQQAEPGEFTARAYFNGRMDLTQAEGVAATIAAQNEQELRAARQLLAGELAVRLRPALDEVAQTLALLEVGIDFSEDDVSFLTAAQLADRIARADGLLAAILGDSARFERLAHEPRIVLAGRPNAGKSTLLNTLAGRDRAVVSPIAGTTRDVIWADVPLPHGMVRLIDIAGLEDGEDGAADDARIDAESTSVRAVAQRTGAPDAASGMHIVEASAPPAAQIARQMRAHALRELESADLLVLVHDPATPVPRLPRRPDLIVQTKADLHPSPSLFPSSLSPSRLPSSPPSLLISSHTGHNIPALRDCLDRLAFSSAPLGATLALNARHVAAIAEARDALSRAGRVAGAGTEIVAMELREALDALGGVLGAITPDELLGRVFAAFCIGK